MSTLDTDEYEHELDRAWADGYRQGLERALLLLKEDKRNKKALIKELERLIELEK